MIAHTLRNFFLGGIQGLQSSQRDCSPFLVHFTSWPAMANIRGLVDTNDPSRPVKDASWVSSQFGIADTASFGIFEKIVSSGLLKASHPKGDENIPKCICLTECNLPSLLSHAERYGRFGLVFEKNFIYSNGGRPCAYLAEEHRNLVLKAFRDAKSAADSSTADWGQLVALCHLYHPISLGGKVQDYTHEREWRLFKDINVHETPPRALLVPGDFIKKVRGIWPSVDQLLSIDDLLDWGA